MNEDNKVENCENEYIDTVIENISKHEFDDLDKTFVQFLNVLQANDALSLDDETITINSSDDVNPYVGEKLYFVDYTDIKYSELVKKSNFTNNCCVTTRDDYYEIIYIKDLNVSNLIPFKSENKIDEIEELKKQNIELSNKLFQLSEQLEMVSNMLIHSKETQEEQLNTLQQNVQQELDDKQYQIEVLTNQVAANLNSELEDRVIQLEENVDKLM